jgi:ABC-type Mn2+/Zn2+ transport system permease subunit
VIFPQLDTPWAQYLAVLIFCLGTAMAIGWFSHWDRVSADAAIGVFLVASLAWGFLAQQIYVYHFHGRSPALFDAFLWGHVHDLAGESAFAASLICLAVIIVVSGLAKELMAYSFDPTAAYTGGVKSGMIHYLLMIMIALVIVVGMRVVGSVLITALLVLPGTIAMSVSKRFAPVVGIAVTSSVIAAVAGLVINSHWRFIPVGPAIVLTLVGEFAVAYGVGKQLHSA